MLLVGKIDKLLLKFCLPDFVSLKNSSCLSLSIVALILISFTAPIEKLYTNRNIIWAEKFNRF